MAGVEELSIEGGGGYVVEERAGISIENNTGEAAVAVSETAPATPAQQLEELERRAGELQIQRSELKIQLAAAIATAASQIPQTGASTGIPVPQEPEALVEELSILHAARQYLQYLQELQALTRHAEKLTRSAERAFAEGDPSTYLRECSDAVDAFSQAMGYAIYLEQLQGRVGSSALIHHGSGVIARVSASGIALKAMLSSAAQQALRQCAWPPPVLGAMNAERENNNGNIEWSGFAAADPDAFATLQHIFIIQITLQRSMEYKAFLSLENGSGPLLWPSMELVAGIAAWLRHHFGEGLPTDRPDRPEWLFAAAIKAAKQCAPAAEELQPSVDAHQLQQYYSLQLDTARAVGSAAVAPLLRDHVLPRLVQIADAPAWLHFVDEAAKFEEKLAPLSGVAAGISAQESSGEGTLAVPHAESILEVLFEREEWAQGWLGAERDDGEHQVDAAVEAPDVWKAAAEMKSAVAELAGLGLGGGGGTVAASSGTQTALGAAQASHHEFYPPTCAETVLGLITALARRENYLFAAPHKARFTHEVVLPTLKIFRSRLGAMLLRIEQFDHLVDHTGLPKVGAAICAAHFMEHSLLEPSGELLLAIADNDDLSAALEKEASALALFRRQWGYKLAKLAVEKFQSAFKAYKKRLGVFSATSEEANGSYSGHPPQGPSPSLLPAADGLQSLLHDVASRLDAVVFRDVWRAVAVAVNSAFFNDVATEATFSYEGAVQLEYDLDALIGVFGGCTARPAAHFKESKEACKLLKLGQEEAAGLYAALYNGGAEAQAAVVAAGFKALNAEQAASVLMHRADLS